MRLARLNDFAIDSQSRLFVAVVLLLMSFMTNAQTQAIYPFESTKQQQQFNQLIQELRCVICQNQNLADSNADMAITMRNKVYELVKEGRDDREIKEFLTERYGDFVLYSPPVSPKTWALWFFPLILFLCGAIGFYRFSRSREQSC